MLKLRIKIIDIWCWVIFFIMMDFPFVDSRNKFIIKMLFVIVMFVFAVIYYRPKHMWADCWPVIPYSMCIIYSSYCNYGTSDTFFRACCYGMIFMAVYIFPVIIGQRYGFKNVMESLYRTLLIIVIIADITVVLTNGKGVDLTLYLGNFIIGNKFVLSYFNMFFLALYCICEKRKNKCKFLIVTLISVLICMRAGTATGAVGIIVIAILYLFTEQLKNIMCIHFVFFVSLAISSMLVIAFQQIVSNPYVATFITDILHRSIDMTGRMQIYNVLLSIFKENIWIGHGYNNTTVLDIVGYGNPQNGIFDILINYGIIGLILFCLMCFASLSSIKRDKEKAIFPVICYLYGLIVCATVEICLATSFILGLSVLRIYGRCKKIDRRDSGIRRVLCEKESKCYYSSL